MNIRQIGNLLRASGDIGIEIEVEGHSLPGTREATKEFDKLWAIHRDGSLRGESYEYVLRKPIPLNKVKAALATVSESYKKCNSKVDDSDRAGVHIHINCQELSIKQVMNFACVYFVVEDLMLEFCSESRRGNHFCLRAKDAQFMIYQLQQVLEGKRLRGFLNDNVRYSSMNFCALPKFGSLEFRALESGSLHKIYTWAKILFDLKRVAIEYDNPIDIVTSMSQNGFDNFLSHVLGSNYKLFKHIPDIDGMVLNGVRHAQDMAYGVDWAEMNEGWTKNGGENPFERYNISASTGTEDTGIDIGVNQGITQPPEPALPEVRFSDAEHLAWVAGGGAEEAEDITDEDDDE